MAKQKFSLERLRAQLLGDTGYEFYLGMSFDDAKTAGGLATSADGFVGKAIQCYLADFVEPGRKLLGKAVQRYRAAIESNERPSGYQPGWHEATRHYGLALARWLLDGVHDDESIRVSCSFRDQHLARLTKPDTFEITCYCPEYLDARAHGRILEHIERTFAGKRLPLEVKYTRSLAMNDGIDVSEGKEADRLFRQRFPEWLTRGHWVRAATWLKVVRWNSNQHLSPVSVAQEALQYVREHQ
jgi:hypothetical protein